MASAVTNMKKEDTLIQENE